MSWKMISSLTVTTALIFGVALFAPTVSLADKKGNPSDCAKIKDTDEKMECHKKALEELKAGKKDRDKDDDKDKKKDKKKKDKKKKDKKKKGKKDKD